MKELSHETKSFIENNDWTFAKTYAKTWPHEYIVQEQVSEVHFIKLAEHIDTYGVEENFFTKKIIYFYYGGYTYWHMENIINRCFESDTYEQKKRP